MKTGVRLWWILVVSAFVLLLSADGAHARKIKGCWRITGIVVGTAKLDDVKETFKDRFTDILCFYSGGRFEGDFQDVSCLSGRWKQKKTTFTAYYNKEQIADFIEDEVERMVPAGVYLHIVITKAYVRGTWPGEKSGMVKSM